jgi:Holliday junction resolvase RusA-like endonuclease
MDNRSFQVIIEGQPPSGNHRLQPAMRWTKPKDGKGKPYVGWRRADGVENYMLYVSTLARRAKPKDWVPGSSIRIEYWLELADDMDCDNATKVISDALAIGLDTDDKHFLPNFRMKASGSAKPRVIAKIYNEA